MDRDRTIELVESEIRRREAIEKMGGFFAKDHLEMALAMREMLATYIQDPFVFREHRIMGTHPAKARGRR